MLIISVLLRQRQESQKLKVTFDCIASLKPDWSICELVENKTKYQKNELTQVEMYIIDLRLLFKIQAYRYTTLVITIVPNSFLVLEIERRRPTHVSVKCYILSFVCTLVFILQTVHGNPIQIFSNFLIILPRYYLALCCLVFKYFRISPNLPSRLFLINFLFKKYTSVGLH